VRKGSGLAVRPPQPSRGFLLYCYRHPKAETELRCQKCERPICTDCVRISPVGARCPECIVVRSSPLYQVGVDRMALGSLAGVASGFVLGCLMLFVSGLGFLLVLGALAGGNAIGEAVLRVIQRKRGPKVEVITGVSAAVGLLLAFGVWYVARGGPADIGTILAALQHRPFFVVGAAIAVFSAVSRVRFF
jgi:hypothetical protein